MTRLVLRIFFGAKGYATDNVPQTGALLVVANHQSYLDPPAVGSFVGARHMEFLGRASLFRFKPFAWLISLLNTVPIQDDQGDTAAIREDPAPPGAGSAVLIFPEGSRTPDGVVHDFKRGAALVMRKGQVPVLPAAIVGATSAGPEARQVAPPNRSGPQPRCA